MKFHTISTVLIILIIDINFGVAGQQGKPVEDNTFNWVVKIIGTVPNMDDLSCGESASSSKPTYDHCTGSIISKWHILSTAHCFNNVFAGNVKVIAGVTCLNSNCRSKHSVTKILIHPKFQFEIVKIPGYGHFETNDVAVLTLETPLSFKNKRIAAIPLPTKNPKFSRAGLSCKVADWGCPKNALTEHLLWNDVKIEECKHSNKLICPKSPNDVTFIRKGDSGAGLLCGGTLTGIVLQAPARGHNHPTLFQNVFKLLPFIKGVLKEDAALLASKRRGPQLRIPRTCSIL